MVSIIDLILIIILAGFIFYGFFFGLIRTVGSLLGLVIGFWIASSYYLPVSFWVAGKGLFFGQDTIGRVIIFLIIFSLANRLVALAFALLDKAFDLISIIPFLSTINRLAGAILGLLLGVVVLGIILHFALAYPLIASWFSKALAGSKVFSYLIKFINVLSPIVPKILNNIGK